MDITNSKIQNTVSDCNKYFDTDYTKTITENVLIPISEYYFRARFIGFENMPVRNKMETPLIFISNHSGMAFSWDSIIFTANLLKKNEYNYSKSVRVLAEPMLSQKKLMAPYLINHFWKKIGCIDATHKNFDAMMYSKEANLMIYPEGNDGLCKGFDKKYQLQKFSNTFLLMSIKHGADIIAFYTINAEYNNPNSYKSERINKFVNKFGVPFLPMGFSTLFLFLQPWLFYFAFPANLTYVMGERITPAELYNKNPNLITNRELNELSEKIRDRMQEGLNENVKKYGKAPFNMKGLFATWKNNFRKCFIFLPVFWPFILNENDRAYKQGSTDNSEKKISFSFLLKSIVMNFSKIIFLIPLIGWLPILVIGLKQQKN
jgi:hypothetical protein